jgi:hypothetical protein
MAKKTTAKKKKTTTKKKTATKKKTTKPVKKTAPKPVVEELKEEVTTDDEAESKVGVFFGKMKSELSKIPTDIEEPENKLQMTTSKLFALTGSIFAVFEGRALILMYQSIPNSFWQIAAGIVGVLMGLFMFITLNIIDYSKVTKGKKIPYKWYILMGLGIFLVVFFRMVSTIIYLKGGVCFLIGGFILLLQGYKENPDLKKTISFIGIGIGIWEGLRVGMITGTWTAWLTSGVIWLMLIILLLSLLIPDKMPTFLKFEWWLVLTIGMAMLYLGLQLSGVVIIHVFLLLLIDM